MSKYSISQNFLTAGRTIERLMNLTDIGPRDHVIEIGAGKGHITRALAPRCGALTTYEVDSRLAARLGETLTGENIKLVRGDFLKAALPKTAYKVFSNLPFNITTPIVNKLVSALNPPCEAWLVMEKGAAIRFLGQRETRASLLLKCVFEGRIVWYFSREDFHPAPRVDVVMIHLTGKETPDIPHHQRKAFAGFVDRVGSLGLERVLTRRQIQTALRRAGLEPVRQSATMDYVQWLCLFRCSLQYGGGGQ